MIEPKRFRWYRACHAKGRLLYLRSTETEGIGLFAAECGTPFEHPLSDLVSEEEPVSASESTEIVRKVRDDLEHDLQRAIEYERATSAKDARALVDSMWTAGEILKFNEHYRAPSIAPSWEFRAQLMAVKRLHHLLLERGREDRAQTKDPGVSKMQLVHNLSPAQLVHWIEAGQALLRLARAFRALRATGCNATLYIEPDGLFSIKLLAETSTG